MNPEAQQSPALSAAVGILMDRHGAKWLRFAGKVLRDQAEAEDVLQEAVHRVLQVGRDFESVEQTRKYLARAISNTAIEFYHNRRRERLRRLPLQEHLIAHESSVNPLRMLEQRETHAERTLALSLLGDGLDHLPAKQYEALCMTVLNPSGDSIREVGAENGIPYSTLRHRSVQGIRRLRKYLRRAARISKSKPIASLRDIGR